MAALAAPGRTIVLVEPLAHGDPDTNPRECLAGATFIDECRFIADTTVRSFDRAYRRVAEAEPAVEVANLDRLVCPNLPTCDPMIDGTVVWWDHQHLTRAYSTSLGDDLAELFGTRGWLTP